MAPRWAALLLTFLLPASAAACPSCPIGRQARAEVWSEGFGLYLLVALLPFALIGALCWWLESPRRPSGWRLGRSSLVRPSSARRGPA